jgi:cytochrome c-type biogenesis protein CcmH
MIAFLIAAALLLAVALAFLLPPLLKRSPAGGPSGSAANLSVYRDQLGELEADLARGTISADQHAQAKLELERRVLEEVGNVAATAAVPRNRNWIAAGVVGVAIPTVAAVLYLLLGQPAALDPVVRLGMTEQEAAERKKMLDLTAQLARKMESRPDDVIGWTMLGRSYLALGKPAESALAFGRAAQLKPQDAGILADLAEALAVAGRGSIGPQAVEVANRALGLDPQNAKALALLGTAAFETKDYPKAIALWERLLKLAEPGSEYQRAVQGGIAEARAALAASTRPKAAGLKVTGRVELAGALKSRAAPDDAVFVFARAANGPRMPLAILRMQVKDLPADFSLDDTMAMAEGLQLSAFPLVIVGARVSKSGSATPASGDLEGASAEVKPGASGIAVLIDRVRP